MYWIARGRLTPEHQGVRRPTLTASSTSSENHAECGETSIDDTIYIIAPTLVAEQSAGAWLYDRAWTEDLPRHLSQHAPLRKEAPTSDDTSPSSMAPPTVTRSTARRWSCSPRA